MEKAASHGEPSYVWRAGQDRRLQMILDAAGDRIGGRVLENGCGIGMYVKQITPFANEVVGLEYDFERARQAAENTRSISQAKIVCAAGENLPFLDEGFDVIVSHEVLEHVQDDRLAVSEMVRTLRSGGCVIIFVPNRGYPFETHGVYWRGKYHFGNIPLVNYLPRAYRDQLAPHVRVYSSTDLERLFVGLPVVFELRDVIFGAYDNIIERRPKVGRVLRSVLQWMEKTPLSRAGLSHFWVVRKQ